MLTTGSMPAGMATGRSTTGGSAVFAAVISQPHNQHKPFVCTEHNRAASAVIIMQKSSGS